MDSAMTDEAALAREILNALDERRQIPCITERIAEFDQTAAYRVSREITRLRRERGEVPIGRKIGFTNRTIWDEYKVYAPIWGPVYSTTVKPGAESLSLEKLVEPRIEPEILLKLGKAPSSGMSDAELMSCVSHVAHSFEIVQSLFAGWRFQAADTVAAFALHGALVHGPFSEITAETRDEWRARLANFRIVLFRNGEVVDEGVSSNVLDAGPLAALRHLADVLAGDAAAPAMQAGEIISTGTLTRAMPVAPGERWSTAFDGLPLDGLRLRFE
ncbi:2-keto-4-pentenoate hydratase [Hongsoonwoonella zoysiae]|uniref:2-keto-4-pentenoate hydratase n=1 Tax=Hongsoonwoonella zoysiae TaxID=2821844 RepID=UPI001FEB8489|nr:fumarylacetoacetate hydrolase family protein [Hongsoonwoonella zoysiae]